MNRYCMCCMNPLEDGYPCPHCSASTHPVNALHQLPTGAMLAGKYLVGE